MLTFFRSLHFKFNFLNDCIQKYIIVMDCAHYKFILSAFQEVNDQDLICKFPTITDDENNTKESFTIAKWYGSNISEYVHVPLISNKGHSEFYSKCYCYICESWFSFNFKNNFINQHISTRFHKCRSSQSKILTKKDDVASLTYSVIKNVILFILLDGKPISNIESQYLTSIGPKLPNRQSFTKSIKDLSTKFTEIVKQKIEKMTVCYICIDEWSDKRKRHFLGTTLQGVKDNMMENFVISFKKIDALHVTAEYLQKKVNEIRDNFNIKSNFSGIVTDGASNMVAFDNHIYNRHCCICHVLNLLLQDLHELFQKYLSKLENFQCSIKNSSLFTKLCEEKKHSITRIPSYCPTRFYSLYNLIHSFNISYQIVIEFLNQKITDFFNTDDFLFYQEFELLIEYFKDSIQLFEKNEFGQIAKIHTELYTVKDAIKTVIQNSQYLKKYQKNIEDIMNSRFDIIYKSYDKLVFASALLHPNHLYSTFISPSEKNIGTDFIRDLLKKEKQKDKNYVESNITLLGETKSQREYLIRNKIIIEEDDELEIYFQQSPTREQDPMKYWIERKERFPYLYKVAINILSTPTSSASIERFFSKVKELLGDKQLKTNEDLLEARMILIGNRKEFHDFFDLHWLEYFPLE